MKSQTVAEHGLKKSHENQGMKKLVVRIHLVGLLLLIEELCEKN